MRSRAFIPTFTDHLGTPILRTNAAGAVDWRAEYDPYGTVNTLRAGATRHQPLRLRGQEYDEASADRSYNIFRWYRGGWGGIRRRILWALPPGFHLFAYVSGNPINDNDPLGLEHVNEPGFTKPMTPQNIGPMVSDLWHAGFGCATICSTVGFADDAAGGAVALTGLASKTVRRWLMTYKHTIAQCGEVALVAGLVYCEYRCFVQPAYDMSPKPVSQQTNGH